MSRCPAPDWIDLGVGCYHFSRAWPMTYDKAASYCINMGMHSARKIAIIAEPTNSLIQERLKLFASNMKLGKSNRSPTKYMTKESRTRL